MNTIFIPRNIEERKIKFRKENLQLLQQEILTVNTEDGWLELDDYWKDINPKYVKTKQINGDVRLKFNEDGHIPEWLQNITINGYFYCYDIGLTSLKGCPKIIKKTFYCSYNQLTTLEYGPIEVGENYRCNKNKLTSLKGCSKIIKGNFYCYGNKLSSLKHCPKIIKGNFSCSYNDLTSLKGCSKIIKKTFDCSYNLLTSLEYGPIEVGQDYWCSYNKTEFTKEYVKSICNVQNKIII